MHPVMLHQHQSIRNMRASLQIDVWSTWQKQYQVMCLAGSAQGVWPDGIKISL